MFRLPKLPYEYNALEPYIDAKTMEIHYTKHYQAYADKFNAVLEKNPSLKGMPAEEIIANLNGLDVSDADRAAIRNHGGGFVNHSFFWTMMSPKKEIDQKLVDEIKKTFGSIEDFKKQFADAALSRFGSGWVWLVKHKDGKNLEICSTANQDSPLSEGHAPIITLDVWEHAYYLKYQNRRAEFIDAWWHILKLL
jgi:superoxide dismutase, Fe-Mn family